MDIRRRKRKYRNFSDELLSKVLADIKENNLSVRKAEEKYDIPKSTLNRSINSKQTNKHDHPPVFSVAEENHIQECVTWAAEWGFPSTNSDLKDIKKH
ncbi:hypothetical protein JTB14_017164 [Gonioctena quinquepunctata]|nr:hypothetical protein JTB14_017164 [Gonioctena quinquepunctata]